MKNIVMIIVGVLIIALIVVAAFMVPQLFPKEPDIVYVTSKVPASSDVSSDLPSSSVPDKVYTFSEFIAKCHSAVTGQVIKIDETTAQGVTYTINIIKVYKGRNLTSLGTVYVSGETCLELNSNYLFLANVGEGRYEQYQYSEPFTDAPWIFKINDEDNTLTHSSNGDINIISDDENFTLEKVKEITDAEKKKK